MPGGTNGEGGLRWDATAQDTKSASAQEACEGTQQPKHQERNVRVVALTTTTGNDGGRTTTTPEPINHSQDALVAPRLTFGVLVDVLVTS